MTNIITIPECLEQMNSGQPFTLSFVTYDRTRKKGGQYKTIEAIVPKKEKAELLGREETEEEIKIGELSGRNPNHQKWYTRNVVQTVDGHPTSIILKVHPPLFAEFNGRTVVP